MCTTRLIAFFLAVLVIPLSAAQVAEGQTFNVEVKTVTDGDTFEARRSDGQSMTIRLFGVDAPESDQPYGSESTSATREYIGGKNIRVSVDDTGPYGRTIGSVEVQGTSLAQMLIRDGLAWHYDRYAPNATELARLERQARNANRGLWSEAGPISPWDWRDFQYLKGPIGSPIFLHHFGQKLPFQYLKGPIGRRLGNAVHRDVFPPTFRQARRRFPVTQSLLFLGLPSHPDRIPLHGRFAEQLDVSIGERVLAL